MRVLLDTNILIHREGVRVMIDEIGELFRWLDKLKYEKCIHPLSVQEINKHKDPEVVRSIQIKLDAYHLLKTVAADTESIMSIREDRDVSDNDRIDTSLLTEVVSRRVDYFITEDRKIHGKALKLGISNAVFTVDSFLEKVLSENPELLEYKVLSVKKEYFGDIDVKDPFFDSFRDNYKGFDDWFNKKSDEEVYVNKSDDDKVIAFLYIKKEDEDESYRDIEPQLTKKSRLKIGTLKVTANGYNLGERLLKIVFDNALKKNVSEIYVTLFSEGDNNARLIGLLEDWGFKHHGTKTSASGEEDVYIKDFRPVPDKLHPKLTYPFITRDRNTFIVPIYPDYHTDLLPDSMLRPESPSDYTEDAPHRNAIQKVYISRSWKRNLQPGDIILFYRTGGRYISVISTIGIVENIIDNILSEDEFIKQCRKRSVFSDKDLKEWWNYNYRSRPFIVNFLYLYTFPKRLNLDKLINLGIIADMESAPRGFEAISREKFETIMRESNAEENFIIN